jgi:hypothetical protein
MAQREPPHDPRPRIQRELRRSQLRHQIRLLCGRSSSAIPHHSGATQRKMRRRAGFLLGRRQWASDKHEIDMSEISDISNRCENRGSRIRIPASDLVAGHQRSDGTAPPDDAVSSASPDPARTPAFSTASSDEAFLRPQFWRDSAPSGDDAAADAATLGDARDFRWTEESGSPISMKSICRKFPTYQIDAKTEGPASESPRRILSRSTDAAAAPHHLMTQLAAPARIQRELRRSQLRHRMRLPCGPQFQRDSAPSGDDAAADAATLGDRPGFPVGRRE